MPWVLVENPVRIVCIYSYINVCNELNAVTMKETVRILSSNAIHVKRIASLLEENHIPSMIKDNVESARIAGFGVPENSVELYVYESDVEKAQQVIADSDNQHQP